MELYFILAYILAYIGIFAASFYIINVVSFYKKNKIALIEEKTNKSVTIVIPAFNEEEGIAATIDSALSLDYPKEKIEVIVVDDGSQDATYKIAKKFETKNNPRVRVFTKPNGGKGSALNKGIKEARGEIIISMDADTVVTLDALKKMIVFFKDEEVMAVTPSMGIYKPKTIWQRVQHIEYYMGVFLRKSFATMNAIHITPGAFSAYRKSFFEKYGGYDEKNITEDLEIALRIQSKDFIIENSPEAVIYTQSPERFRELLIQRRRWYTGLIRNLWNYRNLFGTKKGALGLIVLPVAVSTILLSVTLTVYMAIKTLIKIQNELSLLNSINFQFNNFFELNSFVLETFILNILSSKLLLLSLLFISLLTFYLLFAKRKTQYNQSMKLNLFLFLVFYSFLFAFWWIVSIVYVTFNKKVVWR